MTVPVKNEPSPADSTTPISGEVKKAGTFDGDLRNLPAERPIRRDRPRRPDPVVAPRPLPTPTQPKKPTQK